MPFRWPYVCRYLEVNCWVGLKGSCPASCPFLIPRISLIKRFGWAQIYAGTTQYVGGMTKYWPNKIKRPWLIAFKGCDFWKRHRHSMEFQRKPYETSRAVNRANGWLDQTSWDVSSNAFKTSQYFESARVGESACTAQNSFGLFWFYCNLWPILTRHCLGTCLRATLTVQFALHTERLGLHTASRILCSAPFFKSSKVSKLNTCLKIINIPVLLLKSVR